MSPAARTIGHAANVLVTVNALVFMIVVILASDDRSSAVPATILSSSYRDQGFCVSNTDKSVFVQSHFLAFYVDLLGVAVLRLYLKCCCHRSDPAQSHNNNHNNKNQVLLANYLKGQFVGIIMHGVAHADYAYHRKPREELFMTPIETYDSVFGKVSYCGGLLLFWWFVLRGIAPEISARSLLLVCAATQYVFAFYVPGRFGFAYVQTVIYVFAGSTSIVYATSHPLFQNEPQLYSAVALARLINGAMGWIEATQCDTFFKTIGGHVWYDAMIPLSLMGVLLYANYYVFDNDNNQRKVKGV